MGALQLVRPPSDPTAAPKVLGAVQNFLEDATMFEWAGVGFGKQESIHLHTCANGLVRGRRRGRKEQDP